MAISTEEPVNTAVLPGETRDGNLDTPAGPDLADGHAPEVESAVSGIGLDEPGNAASSSPAESAEPESHSETAVNTEKDEAAVHMTEAPLADGNLNVAPSVQDDLEGSILVDSYDTNGSRFEVDADPVDSEHLEAVPRLPAGVVNPETPSLHVEPGNAGLKYSAAEVDLKIMQGSLQEVLSQTQSVSLKTDAVSNDIAVLLKQVSGISEILETIIQKNEASPDSANTKKILSRMFLCISSFILVLLVVFQVYSFISLIKVQRLQDAAGASLQGNISSLNNKLVDFDKKLALTLVKPVQQEHSQQNAAKPETAANDVHGIGEAGSAFITPMAEKLNKLRNGFPEKKLIRKETGDWFVYNKKGNENISDIEVIKTLNEAYTKSGRRLTTSIPLPPHNAVCLLKADGKGGTLVAITGELIP